MAHLLLCCKTFARLSLLLTYRADRRWRARTLVRVKESQGSCSGSAAVQAAARPAAVGEMRRLTAPGCAGPGADRGVRWPALGASAHSARQGHSGGHSPAGPARLSGLAPGQPVCPCPAPDARTQHAAGGARQGAARVRCSLLGPHMRPAACLSYSWCGCTLVQVHRSAVLAAHPKRMLVL